MSKFNSVRGVSRIAAVAMLAAAGLASAPSFAATSLVIKRNADPQVTYTRLQGAAAQLCGSPDRRDLARYRIWQRCYERTLDGAVDQMQEPALLALHRRHQAEAANGAG